MQEAMPDAQETRDGSVSSGQTRASAQSVPDVQDVGIALDAGKVGIWSWDIKSSAVKWSGNMENIHGVPTGSFDGTFSAFQGAIHPEDQPEIMAAAQESMRSGKPFDVHYRLAPQDDKEERWVEAMASVIQENGLAVRMLGTCRDVTDRQRLLRELRV